MHCNQLPSRLQRLISLVEQADQPLAPRQAKQIMGQAEVELQDLQDWVRFNHSATDSYGRALVYHGGFFEVMVLSWSMGDMSSIHDHGETIWGATQFFGSIEHAVFQFKNGICTTVERREFSVGNICPVDHELIHQMGNNSNANCLSLHLYGCKHPKQCITGSAKVFDLYKQRIAILDGGMFYGLADECYSANIGSVQADFPTWIRDHVELLHRLMCQHDSIKQKRLATEQLRTLAGSLFSEQTWQRLEKEIKILEKDQQVYQNILRQSLLATAKMQLTLAQAGLLPEGCEYELGVLAELVNTGRSQLDVFWLKYLHYIEQIHKMHLRPFL